MLEQVPVLDETFEITIEEDQAGARVDRFVAEGTGLSRSFVQGLIESGLVTVNGQTPKNSRPLAAGDLLTVTIPPPRDTELVPQNLPVPIVYEDDALVVVDKPKGMVVHPAPGHEDGTLVNALLYHTGGKLSTIGEMRPGIVHRIDKDTSGLLVVAKTDAAHRALAEQFTVHSIDRSYQAVVYGGFAEQTGEVQTPIGRSPKDRKKMATWDKAARPARTMYQVVRAYPGFTHLALTLDTGRTHQIRVHMASIGHPVAGDPLYGPQKVIRSLHGQCLHAATLGFDHPTTGERVVFHSPLPGYFTSFLHKLETTGAP